MAEMNPIVQTLLQLIQLKQQDEALAERKAQQEAENQFRMEQLSQAEQDRNLQRKHQDILEQIEFGKLRQATEEKFREQVAGGLRKVQGYEEFVPGRLGRTEEIPLDTQGSTILQFPNRRSVIAGREPNTRTVRLPNGHSIVVPMAKYDISQSGEESTTRFTPFTDQIIAGPSGKQVVEDVVSFPEAQEMKLKGLRDIIGLDVLKAGLITGAQETARQPGREYQAEQALSLREYQAERSTQLQQLRDKAAMERIEKQTAAQVTAAGLRSRNLDIAAQTAQQDIQGLEQDAKYGVIKLGNTLVHNQVRNGLRKQNLIPFDPKDAEGMQDAKNLEEVISTLKVIKPLLGTNMFGAWLASLKALPPGDPLKRYIDILTSRAPLLSNVFGIKGTQSDRDIANLLRGVATSTSTQADIDDKIRALESLLRINVLDTRLRGMSNKQKLDELLHFDFNPNVYNRPLIDAKGNALIDKEGNPITIFKQTSEGKWTAFDLKSRTWEDID